jgi:hypothetical protein
MQKLKKIKGSIIILCDLGLVWERGCGCVPKKFEIVFFLLKFNMVCMF